MKIEAFNTYWVFNGTLEAIPDEMRGVSVENPVVYEVIRVKDGVPVFLKAHLDRLKNSMELMLKNKPLPSWLNTLEDHFHRLVQAEEIINQNIKMIVWNIGHPACSWCMFPIESHYPDPQVYRDGVVTELLKSERATPTAKIYHDTLSETVQALRKETGVFEVLLVDRKGCLTEGSRSNLFLVKGERVYSAPEDDILHGITREKLKRVLEDENIPYTCAQIKEDDLSSFDAAFLTGTSIHVLPIRMIGSLELNSGDNQLVKAIMKAFERSIEKDVENV